MEKVLALAIALVCISTELQAEPIDRSHIWVKDGDTIVRSSDGSKHSTKDEEFRLVDFDAPETTRAKCPQENEKSTLAAARRVALLKEGRLDLTEIKCSCTPKSDRVWQVQFRSPLRAPNSQWQACRFNPDRGRTCGALSVL
jgi:hypothetical protein